MRENDVHIAVWMEELDTALKDNQFHDGWYSVNEVARHFKISTSQARYWLEKGVKHGLFERTQANLGHGYYWWYEFKRR